MKVFNLKILFLTCIVTFLFSLAIVHVAQVFAQVCGGSPSCTSQLYNISQITLCVQPDNSTDPLCLFHPNNFETCFFCDPYTDNNQGYSCAVGGGHNYTSECGACVAMDMYCNPEYLNTYSGTVTQGGDGYNYGDYLYDFSCYQGVNDGPYPPVDASCGNVTDQKFCTQGCATYCNQTPYTNCGACNYPEPTNTCGSTNTTQSCQYGGPSPCTPSGSVNLSCGAISYNNCSANYTCPAGAGTRQACVTNINVHVYVDYNHNGTVDAEDVGLAGVTVSGNAGSGSTDGTGSLTLGNLTTGNYTVNITVPAGYAAVSATSQNVTLSNNAGNQTVNFTITPLYTISGRVYNDEDSGHCYNPTTGGCTDNTTSTSRGPGKDTLYTTTASTVTVTGTGVNFNHTDSTGTFTTGQTLESGTYTISYTSLPSDYHITYPTNGTPPTFTMTVGTPGKSNACSTNNANDATCDGSGNIANVGFGINNHISWHQGSCTDIRDEKGTQDFIPNNPVCGSVSGAYAIQGNAYCPDPGIYFSGTVTPDFGHGTANQNNWIVGGATSESFTPVNPDVIRTSNEYLLTTMKDNGLTSYDLSAYCTTTGCYLPDNLPSGVYTWPYDVTILGTHNTGSNTDVAGTYTFPTGKNYVFLIGDSSNLSSLTFKSKIFVPNGSTVTFSTSQDINVDPSIGESDVTSTAPDLEGFYSADRNFVIESSYNADNRCHDDGTTKDLRFNLVGSAVANAAEAGGSFLNQRDLCSTDLACPTYTIGCGTDPTLCLTYFLNPPSVIKHKNTFWQELAP